LLKMMIDWRLAMYLSMVNEGRSPPSLISFSSTSNN
jgi:hypothetical protein